MALEEYIATEVALDCADGLLSRREAMRRLALMGLSGAAAAALLAACGDDDEAEPATPSAAPTASGQPATSGPPATESPGTVSPATEAMAAPTTTAGPPAGEEIRFAGPGRELIGVVAEADEPRGAVLVIHENRGLTEHIRSIPARLAGDGYTALAVDLLSAEGGTASMPTEGDATAALGNAPLERMIADLRAGLDELTARAPGAGLAVIGFCFGGGMTERVFERGNQHYGPEGSLVHQAPTSDGVLHLEMVHR